MQNMHSDTNFFLLKGIFKSNESDKQYITLLALWHLQDVKMCGKVCLSF